VPLASRRTSAICTKDRGGYPDGRNLTLWGKAALLYDSEGSITGAIGSIRDITTLKEALGRLEKANRKLLLRNGDAIPEERSE